MIKQDKEAPQEDQALVQENEKCIEEDLALTSSPVTVPPLNLQTCVGSIPKALPEKDQLNSDGTNECAVNDTPGTLHRVPSEKLLPDEQNLETNENITEMQRSEDVPPCPITETEISHPPQETIKQTHRAAEAQAEELNKQSLAVGKSQIPRTNSSPSRSSIGTKLPQKISKSSLTPEKSPGKTVEISSSLSKIKKQATDSIVKKQARKTDSTGKLDSNTKEKKDAVTSGAPCKCESKMSVEKLLKEMEALKKRVAAAEKMKREAIRDSDILQKSMVTLKSAIKAATDENSKLKKQLETTKRDKTEAVRRMTAKWREKLSQLEEKMRMEAEDASNKAESISSKVASSSSKIKVDAEEVPPKSAPTEDPQLDRCQTDLKLKSQYAVRKESREKVSIRKNEVEIPKGRLRRKGVSVGETEMSRGEVRIRCGEVTSVGVSHYGTGCFSMESDQTADVGKVDGSIVFPCETSIQRAVSDAYSKEGGWQEGDEDEHSPANEGECVARLEIISEAIAHPDVLRETEISGYLDMVSSNPPSSVDEILEESLGELVEQKTNTDALKLDFRDEEGAEDKTNPAPHTYSEEPSPSMPIFTATEASPVIFEQQERDDSMTEISHKGGRFIRVKANNESIDNSEETSVFGKKSHTEESLRTETQKTSNAPESKIGAAKVGLTSKSSEKVCMDIPPETKTEHHPRSNIEVNLNTAPVNENGSQAKETSRTRTGNEITNQVSANHVQTSSKSSQQASISEMLKMLTIRSFHDLEQNGAESGENDLEKEKKITDLGADNVCDEDKDNSERDQAVETATEIIHSSPNYWTTTEEENRSNVIDNTDRHKNTKSTELRENSTADGTNNRLKKQEEEMASGVTSMLQTEDITQANIFHENTDLDDQSADNMELETRKYIQDLIDLSSSFSKEEKEAVEELLGHSISASSLLQNLSSNPPPDTRATNESRMSQKSNAASTTNVLRAMVGQASSSASVDGFHSELQRTNTGALDSANSATSLGRGFLAGKLKQCFVYDPEKLNDQSADALKNFMKTVGAGKSEDSKDIS
ncbi:serine-rich adhesin for platelets-like [Hetaerina americana]|uniref:serine-rich adhesin for platelets-like n=1 Tax=Hetaerina americana TaxID=62018 RepID=UPI003A7F48E8